MEYKRYGGNEDLYRANATSNEPILKVIMEGDYRERHFVIGAQHNGHPDAYLEVKEEDTINQEAQEYKDYDGGLSRVHGGSSYFGKAYWNLDDKRIYVGRDYDHINDYNARHPKYGGTKWSIVDILMDIACAENEIEMMNENDPEYWRRTH